MVNFPDFSSFVNGYSQIAQTVPNIIYASNTANWSSNTLCNLPASTQWASNTAYFSSNTAVYACNSTIFTSNTLPSVTQIAQFASNTVTYTCNSAIFASNTLSNLPPTIASATWASNSLPNLVSSTQFASNVGVYASNGLLFLSNTTVWTSNVMSEWIAACAYMGSISPSSNGSNTFSTSNLYVSGYVGVGTSAPIYPVHIVLGTDTALSNFGYLSQNGSNGFANSSSNRHVSLYCAQSAVASEFNAVSDMRIKTNIHDIPDDVITRVMNSVRPRLYQHIDQFTYGGLLSAGFIAQELEEFTTTDLPSSVNSHIGDTPSVMKLYSFQDMNDDTIVLHDVDPAISSRFVPFTTVLSFRDHAYSTHYATVVGIDRRELMVKFTNTPPDLNDEKLFCYGEKVQNFRAVDHKQLFTVSIAATKKLMAQVAGHESIIRELTMLVTELRGQPTVCL